MASIAIIPQIQPSHINPILRVARGLVARGHNVYVLQLADFEDRFRSCGLEFRPLFEKEFPRGSYPGYPHPLRPRSWVAWSRFLPKLLSLVPTVKTLGANTPDLILLDEWLRYAGLVGIGLGIPTVLYRTNLPRRAPARSRSRFRVLADRLGSNLSNFLLRMILGFDRDGTMRRLWEVASPNLPPGFDFPKGPPYPPPPLPVMVLCPSTFELPNLVESHWSYVEPSVDLDRREGEFPWHLLDGQKSLVYCAFGSMVGSYGRLHRRLLERIVSALDGLPGTQLVLATGANIDPGTLRAPPGAIIVRTAPQLALLQKAKVALTHGGLGSVKECILLGVPMIVLPLLNDQPDNAARIVHHGIGVSIEPRSATPDRIRSAVESVLNTPSFRERADEMSAEFRQLEAEQPSLEVLERLLQSSPSGKPDRAPHV
jgi:UDP:flavonoid glycosyltransferase YjiC (YdhE family)